MQDGATVAAERVLGRRRLYRFVTMAWQHVEPTPYVDGRHVIEICAHLEAVVQLQIRNLAIAIPPGFSKSLLCSVFWPAWAWIHEPSLRWMYASVDLALAKRDALKCRALIDSAWYQERWGDRVRVDRSGERADGALEHYTTAGGLRFTTSVGSKAVGWHVDVQVCDDPIKPLEATPTTCTEAREWWSGTMSSRARKRSTFRRVVVQQRVHAQDLVGYAIELGYEALILPLEYDPERYKLPATDPRALRRTSIGGDWRTEPGELLNPARVGPADLADLKRQAGATYELQQNQDPREAGERRFSREKFGKPWRKLPSGGTYVWSWDLRFSSRTDRGSYVVGTLFYRAGADSYWVRERRDRWGFDQTADEIRAGVSAQKGPVLVEDKANGPGIEDHLRNEIPGLVLVSPRGSKTQRADAITPFLGNMHLPAGDPVVETEVLPELERFPAEPNDRADTLTQYMAWAYLDDNSSYWDGMRKLKRGR